MIIDLKKDEGRAMEEKIMRDGWKLGLFGVLDMDGMEEPLFRILDGGIEERRDRDYFYDNRKRTDFAGCLFQYTLSGEGMFETMSSEEGEQGKSGRNGEMKEVEEEGEKNTKEKSYVGKGTGFLIALPDASCYYLPKDGEWIHLYLHFDGSGARQMVERIQKKNGGRVLELAEDSRAVRKLLKLQQKLMEGGRLERYEGGQFLYDFLVELLKEVENPGGVKDSLAQRAAHIMEEEYASIEGIEELAERLKVTVEHLTRTFHREKNLTPIRYLTGIRLQAAMNDLLNTQDSLELVAHRSGFSSGNYFCKVFRRYLNMSPAEYRRSKKGN